MYNHNVFILKDPIYHEPESKTYNFSVEWNKWFRGAKIAPKAYEFKDRDIIIVNINDGDDPYKGYTINPRCKQIHIVHKINRKNLNLLKKATHIVYMNNIIAQIAFIAGVQTEYSTCPRYPLYEFFGSVVERKPFMHIGGWLYDDRIDGLVNALLEAHRSLPINISFDYNLLAGGLISRRDKITQIVNEVQSGISDNSRINIYPNNELPYIIGQFIARTAQYGFIHRNSITIEHARDLINSNDHSILNYDITESSMLSLYQSSGINVIASPVVDVYPLYNEVPAFTFKDFASLMHEIIQKIS